MQAFVRNCRNQCSDGKGEAQATKIARRESLPTSPRRAAKVVFLA